MIAIRRSHWLLVCVASLALPMAACGSRVKKPRRFALRGAVTFAGKAIPAGTIHFDPDTSRGNDGPGGVADIRNGRYYTRSGFGVVGGPHVVRIMGFDGKVPAGPEAALSPLGKPLFPHYQTRQDLPRAGGTVNFAIPAAF